MRLPVVRFANHKDAPRTAFAVPARPGFRRLTEAPLVSENLHDGSVERQRPIEVGHTHEDVGEQRRSFRCGRSDSLDQELRPHGLICTRLALK
jgi:hypothetical protein